MLDSEVQYVIKAMDHALVNPETYLETWQAVHRDFIWVPSKQRYDRAASATNTERIESFKVRIFWCRCVCLRCSPLLINYI